MPDLRTTAIMKTDISGSTARFRTLSEADLHALFVEHLLQRGQRPVRESLHEPVEPPAPVG